MSCLCVFKPKAYNIINAPGGEQVVAEWFQLLGELTPLPSPPFPLCWSQSVGDLQRGHIHTVPTHLPGMLVRAIGAASQMGLAVWMPWTSSPTLWHPQSLLPFYSLLRFQFRWRLTVASVMFKSFGMPSPFTYSEFRQNFSNSIVWECVRVSTLSQK